MVHMYIERTWYANDFLYVLSEIFVLEWTQDGVKFLSEFLLICYELIEIILTSILFPCPNVKQDWLVFLHVVVFSFLPVKCICISRWPHALVGKQQRRHKERLASGHCSSADRHLFVKQSNIMAIEISHKYKYIYKGVIRNIRQHCGWFWDYHHQWGDRTIYLAWCSTWLVLHIASWNCVFSSFNNPIVSLVIFVTAQRLSLSWRRGRDRERGLLQSKPLSV